MTTPRKLRTAIVDDEALARSRVRRLLSSHVDVEVIGEAANGEAAIQLIAETKPDLLFLDVQMPPPDGMSVLRIVREEWLPCTIFTTAFAEHALEAFELHAIDYLLKPYSRERFDDALDRARKLLSARTDAVSDSRLSELLADTESGQNSVERFLVKANDRYLVVGASEIEWIEAAANYIVLHTAHGNHVLRRSIGSIETELDPRRFFRASRSAIVAVDAVREVQVLSPGEHVLLLKSGARVVLTRGLRELQKRLAAPPSSA